MWKRQIAQQQPATDASTNAHLARISLPNGDQIHDISKLYQKKCVKDEQRKVHRYMREVRTARDPLQQNGRQPLDPEFVRSQALNETPEAYYNTDCGNKKSLQRSLEDATNPCLSAFSSSKDRFASTAAYRASTFASVAIGPGTYRSKKRAIQVKKKQVPTPSYLSKAVRFEDTKAQVNAVLSGIQHTLHDDSQGSSSTLRAAPNRAVHVRIHRPMDRARGPLLSTTPRFKSPFFPGIASFCLGMSMRYVASKELCIVNDSPDRFYDISPSCKFTIDASVKSSSFRCSAMQSRASRLSTEAAMVHNTPNCPILPSPTKNTVGPGAYNVALSARRPSTQEGMNYIMMPQHHP
uniref:Uncharacterized protein n=1 Tax=Globisporangium ultimum (strain ATCC 200006 / CBS 805.95 / DAOM BR144) TaxID=431595 RepID=K3X4I5_GLOUD